MALYSRNSPEAVARLVTLMMVSDARVDDAEIELLDRLDVYPMLGLSRARFADVLVDYFTELRSRAPGEPRVSLVDRKRLDETLDLVDDPELRLVAARVMLSIAKADQRMEDGELAVLRHALERWDLTLDGILSRH